MPRTARDVENRRTSGGGYHRSRVDESRRTSGGTTSHRGSTGQALAQGVAQGARARRLEGAAPHSLTLSPRRDNSPAADATRQKATLRAAGSARDVSAPPPLARLRRRTGGETGAVMPDR